MADAKIVSDAEYVEVAETVCTVKVVLNVKFVSTVTIVKTAPCAFFVMIVNPVRGVKIPAFVFDAGM